jgi:hypothetical protein
MSRRPLLLATIGVLGLLSAFVSSVATNWLAGRWTSKLWLAVPLAIVLTAAVAVLTARQEVQDKESTSRPGGTEQRNRARMLGRVRSCWVHGVLEQSLHQMARMELGLETRPEAVHHPWELVVQPLEEAPQALPSGVGITAVFDQLGQAGGGSCGLVRRRYCAAAACSHPDQHRHSRIGQDQGHADCVAAAFGH